MNFLAPAAFAFAASLPVVVVFYLLKRKRVVKLVPSTLLWQKFLAETQASAPFQRLRHNWLLILQLLMLLLVVFALARPYFASTTRGGRLRVVILDASASMQSTDETPSRFAKARAEALKWVDTLHDNDQMVVLLAGANTEVKQSATSDKTALRRALQNSRVTDSPTRLNEAFKLAQTLIRDKTGAEIHLFSDGAVGGLDEFENQNLPIVYHQIGTSGKNAGIVSIDARANPDDPSQRAVFVGVANLSTNEVQTEVQILLDQELVTARVLKLAPRETAPQVFLVPQAQDGVFTARLKTQDDLAVDNQASIVSLLPRPAKVVLVTRGNRFLEKALRAAPNVQLTVASQLPEHPESFDFAVLDDLIPAVWPSMNLLAIHTINTNWFEGSWEVKNPPIVDWKTSHPLLRSVSFDTVRIMESLGVKAPDWGVSLVESPQTPLVVAGERERHRIIWLAFDPLQSTWPLRVTFPIFMANAVEWLNPANSRNLQLTIRGGSPFHYALETPVSEVKVTRPDGETETIPMEANRTEIVYGGTTEQGVYHVEAGTNQVDFAVNLTDSAESDIAPRKELPIGAHASVAATTIKRASLELWRWIALGGLAVLLFEWWYYHRRTV